MNNVYVSLFGSLADIAGKNMIIINGVSDLNSLQKNLVDAYPALSRCSYKIAVKQVIASGNIELNNGDEIALLPPFAGG
jgi:sulfur-carrier protein